VAAAQKKIEDLQRRCELTDTATEFRAARLGADRLQQYKECKAKLTKRRRRWPTG